MVDPTGLSGIPSSCSGDAQTVAFCLAQTSNKLTPAQRAEIIRWLESGSKVAPPRIKEILAIEGITGFTDPVIVGVAAVGAVAAGAVGSSPVKGGSSSKDFAVETHLSIPDGESPYRTQLLQAERGSDEWWQLYILHVNYVQDAKPEGRRARQRAVGPGKFRPTDMALGLHKSLHSFRGEAISGVDLSPDFEAGDTDLMDRILREMRAVVNRGGTLRFTTAGLNIEAAFHPGVAFDKFGNDLYGGWTSRELRFLFQAGNEHLLRNTVFYNSDGEVISADEVRAAGG